MVKPLFTIMLASLLIMPGCTPVIGRAKKHLSKPEYTPANFEGYATPRDAIMQKSTVAITVICPDGKSKGGSGVAISKRHIVTAKHVAMCGMADGKKIVVQRFDGEVIRVHVRRHASGATDATILETDENQFYVYAEVNAARPDIGLKLELLSGATRTYKTGKVSGYRTDDMILSLEQPVLPGDSGSGLFDEEGRLCGITYGFAKAPNKEILNIITIAETWVGIIPPRSLWF